MTCRRRVTEAGHEFACSLEPRRERENPPEQGLPDHSAHPSTGACGYTGIAYWGRLRKQIV